MVRQSDITRLRKEGKLDEALDLAREAMAQQPEDIWIRRAYAWTLYALTKSQVEKGNLKEARSHFEAYEALQMGDDESMLHENFNYFRLRLHPRTIKSKKLSEAGKYREALHELLPLLDEDALKKNPGLHTRIAWEIWHCLKGLSEASSANLKALEKLAGQYRQLDFLPRPSLAHSVVMNQLLRLPEGLRGSFDFLEWFRFWRIPDDLSEKDWLPYISGDIKAPSLAEKVCNAWSKALVQKGRFIPQEEVALAIEKLEAIADAHTEYTWLPYYTAKIRLVTHTGSPEEARGRLLPFVRKKHTEFWAWDLLADSFPPEESELVEACLCKALSCKSDPKYLVKVKARLADIRQKKGLPEDAPLEEGAKAAEAFVFGDQKVSGTAVVEGIDRNTNTVYFAFNRETRGRFPAKKFPKMQFTPGHLFDIQLLPVEKHDKTFWEVLSAQAPAGTPDPEIYQVFSGPFKQRQGQSFGFVEDVFVPPPLVSRHHLTPGKPTTVAAVWALDPRKDQYGWKALVVQ